MYSNWESIKHKLIFIQYHSFSNWWLWWQEMSEHCGAFWLAFDKMWRSGCDGGKSTMGVSSRAQWENLCGRRTEWLEWNTHRFEHCWDVRFFVFIDWKFYTFHELAYKSENMNRICKNFMQIQRQFANTSFLKF